MDEDALRYSLADLLRVMQRLRDPDTGCPWDLKQDFNTIVPSTLEECYELAAAIEAGDFAHVGEELGDVLFQVVFYAQLGSERGLFDFDGIIHTLVEKLLRRHPHVFANGDIEGVVDGSASLEAVGQTWESIKQAERRRKSQGGVLDDVPVALPALTRAQKLQKRASRVGFDWRESGAVIDKLLEELSELRAAMDNGSHDDIDEELGDVLFTCVNLARHLDLDAESSLRAASGKFEQRFRRMESDANAAGDALELLDADAMEVLWERAKRLQP